MPQKDLLGALAEVVARRRKDTGEFSYVFLATGAEVEGKKSVFKMLKSEEAVFDAIKDDHQEEEETDLAFDSRAMKLLPMVPFDDEKDTSAVIADAESALSSSTSSKGVMRDWEALTKTALSKLVAKRRLEGGEFTYIYIPLEKTVAGKKAVFKFLKSQSAEYKKLVQACKNPSETTEQFESRLLQQILVVPYEKDIIEDMEVDDNMTNGKRKIGKQSHDPKKVKLDSPTPGTKPDSSGKTVFVEIEVFSTFEAPHHRISQLGAIEGTNQFFKPVQVKNMGLFSDDVLAKLKFIKTKQNAKLFQKGNTTVPSMSLFKALQSFLAFLETSKGNDKSLNLVSYRRSTLSVLLESLKTQDVLLKRFTSIVTSMTSLAEILQEKQLKAYLPLVPLDDLYNRTMGYKTKVIRPSAEFLVDCLQKTMVKLSAKHMFTVGMCAKSTNAYLSGVTMPLPYQGKANTYSISNSQNFTKKEIFSFEASDATTSKVVSRPPWKTPEQMRRESAMAAEAKAGAEQEEPEVESYNFAPVATEVLYPVLCQPILVKLNTVDENTKFIKFIPNKTTQEKATSANWELLRDSARVFWRMEQPYAFCHLCPSLAENAKNETGIADILDVLAGETVMGQYRELNKTDDEQRHLSTKVIIDLVITQGSKQGIVVGKKPITVTVTLVLRQGSLVQGNVKDFEFRPSDVLISQASAIPGVELVNKFISVDRKQMVTNRAKAVIFSKDKKIIKSGQILGSAVLFQNDVKLLWTKHAEQVTLSKQVEGKKMETPVLQVKHSKKRPLKTMADSRLYAQGSNPILVELNQYQATKISGKFSKAYLQYSDEFAKVIDQNKKLMTIEKITEKDSVVPVIWRKNIPYTFLNVRIPAKKKSPTVDFCDIVKGYELGSWAPVDSEEPKPMPKFNMSICVDFAVNNVCVTQQPSLVNCYLKFKDTEVEKAEVMETIFLITKTYNARLEFLSMVFKPFNTSRLAPQKTATNDMKVMIMVRSLDENPVNLTAREVLADCTSPPDGDGILGFKVCGKKMSPTSAPQMPPEMPPPMPPSREDTYRDMRSRSASAGRFMDDWEEMMEMSGYRGHEASYRGSGDSYGSMGAPRYGGQAPTGYGGGGYKSNIRNPMFEADMDYVEYNRYGRAEMDTEESPMHNLLFSQQTSTSKVNLGNPRFEKRQTWNDGKTWVSGGKYVIDGMSTRDVTNKGSANPAFDSLYQPAFQASKTKPMPGLHRNNLFEQARNKLAGGGVPARQKTWSQ